MRKFPREWVITAKSKYVQIERSRVLNLISSWVRRRGYERYCTRNLHRPDCTVQYFMGGPLNLYKARAYSMKSGSSSPF